MNKIITVIVLSLLALSSLAATDPKPQEVKLWSSFDSVIKLP